MRFDSPIYLLLLILILLFLKYSRNKKRGIYFSSVVGVDRLSSGSVKHRKIISSFGIAALIFIILSAARPQVITGKGEASFEGIDMVLAIDVSGSMKSLDSLTESLPPGYGMSDPGERVFEGFDRLSRVKEVAKRFVQERKDDRIGLAAFAGRATVISPLTTDYRMLSGFVDGLQFGIISDGTAIGTAIASGINLLRNSEGKSRIVILLTDGINNAGEIDPYNAANLAKVLGIRVYTIELGTEFEGQWQTNPALDDDVMKGVAEISGGRHFRLLDSGKLLEVYKEIEKMERTKFQMRGYWTYKDMFPYLVFIALLMMTAEIVLLNTRFRKIP